jgi:predicted transcriptional regulator
MKNSLANKSVLNLQKILRKSTSQLYLILQSFRAKKLLMRNRDRMKIISRILEAVNGGGGTTRTRITYNAFVSHAQMKDYLSYLEDNGMVYYDLESQKFKITEKGVEFVRIYTEIDEMIKIPLRPGSAAEREQLLQQQQYGV